MNLLACVRLATIWIWLWSASSSALAWQAGQPEIAAPLTPQQSMDSMQLSDDLTIQLVASEPLVQDPVAVCWDAQGALYVAEMGDYPQQSDGGRIRRLLDTNGDGQMDSFTLFVPQVAYPTSVLPYRDGILVAAAPDILWFQDLDGDGVADRRQVLLTGFGQGNQQLRVNGLVWGWDGWIYGANGRSGGNIHFVEASDPSESQAGSSLQPLPIANCDFRFHPDRRLLETTGGFTQFGQAFDDRGNRFISWNTIHIRHVVTEQRYLNRNPHAAITQTTAEICQEGSTARIFPLSQTTHRFNAEPPGFFNASCGLSIYRGNRLPPRFLGNAFACEPLSNLLHRDLLQPNQTTFIASRPAEETEREFLAASDPWFRPVNTATGPDGALYVVDFYRPWVEHPQFVADGKARESVDFAQGREFGRIYRVLGKSIKDPMIQPQNLQEMQDADLVELLGHPNAWQRETAQRLLTERASVSPERLRSRILISDHELERLHLFATLNGLPRDATTACADIEQMLTDRSSAIRRLGLQLSEAFAAKVIESDSCADRIGALTQDADPQVQLQALSSLSYFPSSTNASRLVSAFVHCGSDRWIRQAIFAALSAQTVPFLESLSQQLGASEQIDLEQLQWLLQVIASEAPGQRLGWEELYERLANEAQHGQLGTFWPSLVALGVAGRLGSDWVEQFAEKNSKFAEYLAQIDRQADASYPLNYRLVAIGMMEHVDSPEVLAALKASLSADQPSVIQQWAAKAIAGQITDARAELLTESLASISPAAQRTAIDQMIARQPWALRLAQTLQAGQVDRSQLDDLQRQLLVGQLPADLRDPIVQLWNRPTGASKDQTLIRYLQSYQSGGDPTEGRRLYEQHCQSCHAIGAQGHRVGPDLTAVAGRSPEDIIIDILDPNRSVAADGQAYTILTLDGEVLAGVIAGESSSSITLKKAGGELVSVLREDIQQLRHLGKSLMPDGFESTLTPQQINSLVAYLKSPH